VIHRVYEYRPGAANEVLQGVRHCISSGGAQALSLPALGDDSVAAQTSFDQQDGKRVYVGAAIIRRGDFITLVLYNQVGNGVEASQLEPFALKADRRLASAIFEAPPR
jgi:hypothetical protein